MGPCAGWLTLLTSSCTFMANHVAQLGNVTPTNTIHTLSGSCHGLCATRTAFPGHCEGQGWAGHKKYSWNWKSRSILATSYQWCFAAQFSGIPRHQNIALRSAPMTCISKPTDGANGAPNPLAASQQRTQPARDPPLRSTRMLSGALRQTSHNTLASPSLHC